MSTLIRIGKLVMTPEQLKRAYDEDMTVSQALRMIEEDKRREYDRVSSEVSKDLTQPELDRLEHPRI